MPTRLKEKAIQHPAGHHSKFCLGSANMGSSKRIAAVVVVVAAAAADFVAHVAGRQRWNLHCPVGVCVSAPICCPNLLCGSHGCCCAWGPTGLPVGSSRNIHDVVVVVVDVAVVGVARPSSGWTSSGLH